MTRENRNKTEEQISKRIIFTILCGCLFFSIAFMAVFNLQQSINQSRYLNVVEKSFESVYDATESFLTRKENIELFLDILRSGGKDNELRYRVGEYNAKAPLKIKLMLSDGKKFTGYYNFSSEEINLHRKEFNELIGRNTVKSINIEQGKIYNTVYYFSGENAEYAMSMPIFFESRVIGTVTAYLEASSWQDILGNYQYDTILTNDRDDIIFCSNSNFIQDRRGNKYKPVLKRYITLSGNGYRIASKIIADRNIKIHSFAYVPENYTYIGIGILTILMLGVLWFLTFREIWELHGRNLELAKVNGKMEIRNLQDRMNPHFIYNTLENIKYLLLSDPKKAGEMIEHFTHILRYSISNTKKEVPVSEDISYLEDYFFIQKIRFGERFTYEINIEESCKEVWIPKLLIQPIIENSIKYGFRQKEMLHVRVHCYIEGEYFCATVEDNGGGVGDEELKALRESVVSKENKTEHNGLYNIARRVFLEYGKESGMRIDSIAGEGFAVRLRLALRHEDI